MLHAWKELMLLKANEGYTTRPSVNAIMFNEKLNYILSLIMGRRTHFIPSIITSLLEFCNSYILESNNLFKI